MEAADTSAPRPNRRPTMGDVAEAAGVSRPLVSIVMRDAPGASDATRKRVREVANELGYVPDERARKLRQKSSLLLGVAFELQDLFHGDVVEQLYPAAARRGYDLMLSAVAPTRSEATAVESLIRERCEAAIVLSLQPDASELTGFLNRIPLVTLGRRPEGLPVGAASVDDDAGLRMAVEYLADLGHERIAHVDGGHAPGSLARRTSYLETMTRLGLTAQALVVLGGPTEEDGAAAMRELAGSHPMPSAVIAFNDRCASGVLDVAAKAGLQVPRDLSVMGFDDSRQARTTRAQLSTIAQPISLLADAAVGLALDQVAGAAPGEVVVEPQLVIRDTTGRPRAYFPA